jgi:8-oxo-dGTP pyrophosphatase MutT (NUDIX family)
MCKETTIRNSAKAIIIRNDCVLLIQIGGPGNEWYVLPGGGQQFGESLSETVRRECLEEIGVEVQVGELRLIRDYIGKNHDEDDGVHRVEFMFECQIGSAAVPNGGLRPDSQQTGIVWAPLADLASYCLYPTGLVQILRDGLAGCAYMGDVA